MAKRPPTPEKLAEVQRLLAEGASQLEITRSTHCSRETIVKYFPDHRRWTYREAGSFGRMIRTARKQGLL